MFTENEAPLQLSHKRSERYRERHRGSRPLQSLTPNQLPPLVILQAKEYRRQHPERTFVSHKRKHTSDFAVHVDKEDTHIYDENYTNKIPRIDKTDGKSVTDDLPMKEQHVRRPSLASIRSQGSRHTLLPASGSSQQQPQSPPPTPPRHQSPQQQQRRTSSPLSQSLRQQTQSSRSVSHVVPHKRKHAADFAVYVDKEDTHVHDEKDNNKTPLIDKTDGVSITKNLVTKEPESSSSPQSPQQQSQPPPSPPQQPSQLPQVPMTDYLTTKEPEPSSSIPPQSPQQQSQSSQVPMTDDLATKEPEPSSLPPSQSPQQQLQSPPPPAQLPQVPITDSLITKEPEPSPPAPHQSPQQQTQSVPPPPQSPQKQSQSPLPPPPQSPRQQPQSIKSDNHHDTASEMGGIPDDVDFEIDFDFGDMGASMHDEQEDRPVNKTSRRDSTPRASAHDDDDDRAIEKTHQVSTTVHNEDNDALEITAAATSDELEVDQHEILERVVERLADQKMLLINPDTIGSIEMIKDKLNDAMLGTPVRISQKKAVAQFQLVDQVLEMIQVAVANVTNIQDDMLQAYLEMFLNYVIGPLGDHVRNLKDQKKSEARLRRIRYQKNAVRVKMLSEQQQARKIRKEIEQMEDKRKKIQKEQESYMELKDFLDALDTVS